MNKYIEAGKLVAGLKNGTSTVSLKCRVLKVDSVCRLTLQSAGMPQRNVSDVVEGTLDPYKKTCNQVFPLFLGDNFCNWKIVITVPTSQ